jgi:uncharacterized protein
MTVDVAVEAAASVNEWAAATDRFSVVWHGGEPLAAGRDGLAALMAPFRGVEHHVQTNATLIDDAWCDFFLAREVRVSISVDGAAEATAQRVDRAGRAAFARIARGVDTLRRREVPFSALAVVSRPRPGLASELYRFFLDLGTDVLGINVEELEGVNTRANRHDSQGVRSFWAELIGAWREDPRIHVREIEWALRYLAAELAGAADQVLPRQLDPIPTIGYDGSVVLLSPELAGFTDPRYGGFASGNVLRQPLHEITAAAADTRWITRFLTGVEACRTSCQYFGFCGGGHAANRYFEHGDFVGTETNHCQNSKISLLEGILRYAGNAQQPDQTDR